MKSSTIYKPFQIPADIGISLKHQKATLCGKPQQYSGLCPCCGREIEQDMYDLCISPIDLTFLGEGIPLFFQFLQQMVMLVIVIFSTMGVFALITNGISNNCMNDKSELLSLYRKGLCEKNCPPLNQFYNSQFEQLTQILQTEDCDKICEDYQDVCTVISSTKISFVNKQFDDEFKEIQAILVLCCIIIFKIIFLFFRRYSKQAQLNCDSNLISASDFTAMLSKLPSNNYTEEELRQALTTFCKSIQSHQNKQEIQIEKLNIAYNISNYISLVRTKVQLDKQQKSNEAYFQHYGKYPEGYDDVAKTELEAYIDQIDKQLNEINKNVQEKIFKQTTQVAFVTFQTRKQLDLLLSYTKVSKWYKIWITILGLFGRHYQEGFYFKGQLVHFIRAPEPDDIFWENCDYNLQHKISWRIVSWVVTTILLIVSFFCLFGLDYVQNIYLSQKNVDYVLLTIFSFIISFIISIINRIIYFSITNLGQKEKHTTRTHYDISVAKKLIYVQFINSALLIMATNILVSGLSDESKLKKDIILQKLAFSRPGGVAADAFIITLFNAIFTPLLNYFDVFYLIKLIKQHKLKNSQTNNLTQTEANVIFEGPQVLLYDNYSYIVKTIWITFFFAPLVPVCLLFCIFGLSSYYWMQKFLILRRKCLPPLQSGVLNTEMANLITFSPFLIAAGQLWIDYVYDSSKATKIINFVSIGISGLEFVIPFEKLAKIFVTWFDDEQKNVKYSETYLPTDYDRVNPITKQVATSIFLRKKKIVKSLHREWQRILVFQRIQMIMLQMGVNQNQILNVSQNLSSTQKGI